MITKWLTVVTAATCMIFSSDARADTCSPTLQFTVGKDSPVQLQIGSTVQTPLRYPDLNRRFILEGRSPTNDISCEFKASIQMFCRDYDHMGQEVILSPWKVISQGKDGGHNQCVWDVGWTLSNAGMVAVPEECSDTVQVKVKFEAVVRNKGKLQVVDIQEGERGCGKR